MKNIIIVDDKFINYISNNYNLYINDKNLDLYIFNKSKFLSFLSLYNIRYIKTDFKKNYYYLISDDNIYKYIKSKNILNFLLT